MSKVENWKSGKPLRTQEGQALVCHYLYMNANGKRIVTKSLLKKSLSRNC